MIAALMVVLLITQINTSGSVQRLVQGNKQAAVTLAINNRLEEMVNLSFELESKLLTEKQQVNIGQRPGLTDSIAKLQQKAKQLTIVMQGAGLAPSLGKIVDLVNGQAALSYSLVTATNPLPLFDSLKAKHFGDSIYANALAMQGSLESSLNNNLTQNNTVAARVSLLNRILAFTALLAILLLGTIIIRRQVKQFTLIQDLQEARKMALQSVKVKDQFLANMSHEIRTPLNALKGFSNLLAKTALTEEQQQYNNIITNAGENLLHIVNDILDLSKMEAGAWTVHHKNFSLHMLLNDLGMTYSLLAAEKKLQFTVAQAEDIEDNLIGDPHRLRQVLMNLISNAIKFTNEGEVTLTVKAISKNADAVIINFLVEDTGIGIAPDKLQVIFERFEQINNALVRQQGGTGLGLSITKMIVETMGGNIVVKSQPGEGSQFSFDVQFAIDTMPQQILQSKVTGADDCMDNPDCKAVLLAEDNKVNQLLIQKYFARFGVEPVIAENGEDVLALLQSSHFDLVLMDVQMPVMDGITATEIIRKNLNKTVPVIGMTAYVQPNEIEKCYTAGMNEFIPKPVEEEQFIAVLKKYIYLKSPADRAPEATDETTGTYFGFLEKLCNGNKSAINLIVGTMKAELPKERKLFVQALEDNNIASLHTMMHHLKSTISPLGKDAAVVQMLNVISSPSYQLTDAGALQQDAREFLKALDDCSNMLNTYGEYI